MGGGIYADQFTVLNVTNATFSNNNATYGGAIYFIHGEVNVTHTTFNGNTASGGTFGGWGGAINTHEATLTVANSTFSENRSISASATGGGGGIRIIEGSTTVSNTTFFSNTATHRGGAIHIIFGELEVHNSTFSGNSAGEGGGIYNVRCDDGSTVCVFIVNTIVANSTAGGNCSGLIDASSTKNLSTDATCSPGFTQVTPAQLALGSPTSSPAYFPLNPGSVAIDTGTNDDCPATDQRGVTRPRDGNGDGIAICDVGAYEFELVAYRLYLPLMLRNP